MKKFLVITLSGLCLFVYGLILLKIPMPSSRADQNNAIDTQHVTDQSRVVIRDTSTDIGLYSNQDNLYETRDSGETGVMEFLNEQPQVEGWKILPTNYQSSIRKFRQNQTGNESHYFYQQTVNGIPIYASQLALHQRQGNQIYSLQGNVVTNTQIMTGIITEEEARTIALTMARKDTGYAIVVSAVNKVIFNGQAIGVSDDPTNYLTFEVSVKSVNAEDGFGRKYFVSTVDGTVLFSESLTREVLNRLIFNCNNTDTCVKGRNEGNAAVASVDVNTVYDTLGSYYNFLKNSFNRDSYNNQGSDMVANVDYYDKTICPNAWSEGTTIYLCKGLVAPDVVSHEMTHAMNYSGPAFVYANQSGAIDEALADIYASAIDGNWTMGEKTDDGVARSIADPPAYGQPDKLFSSYYFCKDGEENDEGGVHTNGGIFAKAFYLMDNGGSFNSCTVTGVGKDKAYAILYKAEMSYMTSSSNFKTVYNALNQACSDLYGGPNSADCIQVRNSLRATEMDQQPDGSQKSPVCNGGKETAPDCTTTPTATATTQPTATPVPGTPTATPVPNTPTATPTPGTTSSVTIDLKLRLQGVFAKPINSTPVPVKIRLVKNSQTLVSKTVNFNWQSTGILEAVVSLENVTAGGGYILYTKGPLHLERKICDYGPVEIAEGRYFCNGNTLTLNGGTNAIDATGILQLGGDIPDDKGNQDNLINSYDLSLIRNSIGTHDANLIKRLDINYDGAVDGHDFDLANASSQVTLDR